MIAWLAIICNNLIFNAAQSLHNSKIYVLENLALDIM